MWHFKSKHHRVTGSTLWLVSVSWTCELLSFIPRENPEYHRIIESTVIKLQQRSCRLFGPRSRNDWNQDRIFCFQMQHCCALYAMWFTTQIYCHWLVSLTFAPRILLQVWTTSPHNGVIIVFLLDQIRSDIQSKGWDAILVNWISLKIYSGKFLLAADQ